MELNGAPQTVEPEVSGEHRNRPISWVRRGVRMTAGQEAAWRQHGSKYLIEPPRSVSRESIAPGWTFDPNALFHSDARVIVEIGTGRGENIVAAAHREHDTNFLGVEVYGPGLARAILLAEGGVPAATAPPIVPHHDGLPIMRLIQADAPELLTALPPSSVDELWVFFPDPWPKSRHLKRRLVDPDFVPLVERVLKPGGIIRLATDWAHYADQMRETFASAAAFAPLPSNDQNLRFEGRVLTAFENKGLKEGRTITDLAYRLIQPSLPPLSN